VVVTPVASRLLVVGGRDRLRFLHAVPTQDVEGLAPGEAAYGALIDDRARPISDFLLYVLPHALLLELPRARAERAREALERLVVADDVVLAWSVGGCVAYEADDPARLAAAFAEASAAPGWPAPDAAWLAAPGPAVFYRGEACVEPAEWTDETLATVASECAAALRASRLGAFGIAHASADPLAECARAAASGAYAALDPTRLDPLQLAAGRPGDAELAGAAVWNELGLEGALSFTKGCYMGQEIVNRVHAQGRLQRRLVGLELEAINGIAWAGGALVDAAGAPVGTITRATRVPGLERTLAFGFVRREAWAPGTTLTARRADGQEARAVVAALPFVTRQGQARPDPLVPVEIA